MILVTHTDLDGVGCEIVARCFYPEITYDKVYHCDYGIVNETVKNLLQETDEKLMISDVSVSEEVAKLIQDKYSKRVRLYDHHQTSEEYLKDYDWCVVDQSKCATKIMFDDLCTICSTRVPITLSAFVYYVNDYDLWHHTLPYSTDFNDVLSLLGKKNFSEVIMKRLLEDLPLINDTDKVYLAALSAKKEGYFKSKINNCKVMGNRLVIIANRYTSDLAEYVRKIKNPPDEWKNVEYIDMINTEKGTHSLRSYTDDFDVSKVAETYGGGGHKKAAGYIIKDFDVFSFFQLSTESETTGIG